MKHLPFNVRIIHLFFTKVVTWHAMALFLNDEVMLGGLGLLVLPALWNSCFMWMLCRFCGLYCCLNCFELRLVQFVSN